VRPNAGGRKKRAQTVRADVPAARRHIARIACVKGYENCAPVLRLLVRLVPQRRIVAPSNRALPTARNEGSAFKCCK
jgi:hypothetical protein